MPVMNEDELEARKAEVFAALERLPAEARTERRLSMLFGAATAAAMTLSVATTLNAVDYDVPPWIAWPFIAVQMVATWRYVRRTPVGSTARTTIGERVSGLDGNWLTIVVGAIGIAVSVVLAIWSVAASN